ncbi:conserved exported protein of unknown function [Nitrospira japonica]|uniref:Sialate O-acetylesterase domain-containing protein n=2 Tax=Nitrospira japonica TaxID=1325564 RepID=A0A1W1I688_9BACT|nr:conserved exported protein of unknown function [Nitrospira japonica]
MRVLFFTLLLVLTHLPLMAEEVPSGPSSREEVPLSPISDRHTMVALVLGQSNAANHGESRWVSTQRVYNFYQGKLYHAEDPLLGATGDRGSVWTRLGDLLVTDGDYDAVIFVAIAVGSSAVSQWAPGGDLSSHLQATLNDTQKAGLPITHIFWHQGEADAHVTSKTVYMQQFRDMVRAIRENGITAPIMVSIATVCGGNMTVDTTIQQAQKELVDPQNGIFAGPNTDDLGEAFRFDRCHFSTKGLDEAARLWHHALRKASLSEGHEAQAHPAIMP